MKRTIQQILFLIFPAALVLGQSYSGGSGTPAEPYLIATKADLKYLSEHSSEWAKSFKQITDITFDAADFQSGGEFYNNGEGFVPIGNIDTNFNGSYDGNGYKIDGLYIFRSSDDQAPFGFTYFPALIQNLGVINVNITGDIDVGGLVGNADDCIISKCYSTGSVSGHGISPVGGLVGKSETSAEITNCYSNCSVTGTGNGYFGGLVGYNQTGNILNCYSMGSVSGGNFSYISGLVGYEDAGSINNCYSTGSVSVSGTGVPGGLVAHNTGGSINNSFWDTQTSGRSISAGGTGKTTVEMKTQSTFTDSSWDFTNVWQIVGGDGANYPDLRTNSNPALPVELSSFSAKVYKTTVNLKWETATEVNNYGFNIERNQKTEASSQNSEWEKIGFVKGSGNSTSSKHYSYVDNNLTISGGLEYRLKQIDYDGKFKYSKTIEVSLSAPAKIALEQNYPNPFNPITTIKYSISIASFVTLKVYDILGKEVAPLVNEEKTAGSYQINFNAANLSSGVYLYRIKAGNFVETKKFIIQK